VQVANRKRADLTLVYKGNTNAAANPDGTPDNIPRVASGDIVPCNAPTGPAAPFSPFVPNPGFSRSFTTTPVTNGATVVIQSVCGITSEFLCLPLPPSGCMLIEMHIDVFIAELRLSLNRHFRARRVLRHGKYMSIISLSRQPMTPVTCEYGTAVGDARSTGGHTYAAHWLCTIPAISTSNSLITTGSTQSSNSTTDTDPDL
jgi:hypothetical protein